MNPPYVSGGPAGSGSVNFGAISSGALGSGSVGDASVLSGSIASGSVSQFHLSSGAVTSGHVGNAAINSGNVASGSISQFHHSSGSVTSGHIGNAGVVSGSIASGQVSRFHLSSGAVNSGHLANISVVSGSFASGQIFTYHHGSGDTTTRAVFVGPFFSGTSWTAITEETVSGARAVAISESGTIRVAMASVAGRMPAIGAVFDNALSGIQVNVYTGGVFQLSSGLNDFSGSLGQPLWVGRSGEIVTASGSWNSGGLISGEAVQLAGIVVNSGGIVLQLGDINSGMIGGGASLSSGSVTSGHIGNAAVVSGSIASGQVAWAHLSSGAARSGHIANAAVTSGNIASGGVSQFHHSSGSVTSGHIGNAAVVSGGVASGQISRFHLSSGAITSGHIGDAAITSGSIASGAVSSFKIASASIQGAAGTIADHIASGTIGRLDLAEGAVAGGAVAGASNILSGSISSTELANASVVSGSIASGAIDWSHIGEPMPFVAEGRLSLDMDQSVPTSGDIKQLTASGTMASGATLLRGIFGLSGQLLSGLYDTIPLGALIVGSGIQGDTFVVGYSGVTGAAFGSGIIQLSKSTMLAVSGVLFTFIPQIFYTRHTGNRISLFDANGGMRNYTFGNNVYSGAIRILTYDNSQTCLAASGRAKLSGLTDTFQLQRGMEVIMSGVIASGTVITSIDGATHLSISKNAISGCNTGPASGIRNIIFALCSSGAVGSGLIWDVLTTLRSGTPWLQFSNQWTTATSRLDGMAR